MNSGKYTVEQVDTVLDLYFRDHRRPTPFSAICRAIGLPGTENAVRCLLWRVITGYGGSVPGGPRRPYRTQRVNEYRAGRRWWPREDDAMRVALAEDGQLRDPPCDVGYVAAVLCRPVGEVVARWRWYNRDPLGRDGFGL